MVLFRLLTRSPALLLARSKAGVAPGRPNFWKYKVVPVIEILKEEKGFNILKLASFGVLVLIPWAVWRSQFHPNSTAASRGLANREHEPWLSEGAGSYRIRPGLKDPNRLNRYRKFTGDSTPAVRDSHTLEWNSVQQNKPVCTWQLPGNED